MLEKIRETYEVEEEVWRTNKHEAMPVKNNYWKQTTVYFTEVVQQSMQKKVMYKEFSATEHYLR